MRLQKKLDKVTDGATTLLLLPYCAWLSFATYLNAGIWWNNPPPVNKGQGRY
jgi:tryptophan-rich sensory protein